MGKAEETRQHILRKAFELTYTNGYQTTSIDNIIATTGVTKGAFYYHFRNKDEMGLAIISDILKPALTSSFARALGAKKNPLDAIHGLMRNLLLEDDFLKAEHGCPAANLTQEMTPWNDAFRAVLEELTGELVAAMTGVLEKGKKDGLIRSDVNARQVTLFIVSGYWGIRSLGKLGDSQAVYLPYLKELRRYLRTLQ